MAKNVFISGTISKYWNDGESFRYAIRDDNGPVNIYFDSPGGDPVAASTLAEAISEYPGEVRGMAVGQLMSAAVIPFLRIKKENRFIARQALVLIHRLRGGAFGTSEEIQRASEENAKYEAEMADEYARLLDISREKAVALMADERYLTAKEAIDLGIASGYIDENDKVGAAYNNPSSGLVNTSRLLYNLSGLDQEKTEGKNMNKENEMAVPPVPALSAKDIELAVSAERERVGKLVAMSGKISQEAIAAAIKSGEEPEKALYNYVMAGGKVGVEAAPPPKQNEDKEEKQEVPALPTVEKQVFAVDLADTEAGGRDKYKKMWASDKALQRTWFAGPDVFADYMTKKNGDKE